MIEFYDAEEHVWKVSRFPWSTDDVTWLNTTVGWEMYREKEAA